MSDCLFCKIVAGVIPCDKLHEDDYFIAFRDISPQAPVHSKDPQCLPPRRSVRCPRGSSTSVVWGPADRRQGQ